MILPLSKLALEVGRVWVVYTHLSIHLFMDCYLRTQCVAVTWKCQHGWSRSNCTDEMTNLYLSSTVLVVFFETGLIHGYTQDGFKCAAYLAEDDLEIVVPFPPPLFSSTGVTAMNHHTQFACLFWIWCWGSNSGCYSCWQVLCHLCCISSPQLNIWMHCLPFSPCAG